MRGRGVIQELLFDRVLVEPGDGGEPAGDGGAGAAPGLEFPGEAFDVGAADGEQGQRAGPAPGGEGAQVQRVKASLVRPRYLARNPARASRSASVKAGWIVASAMDGAAVVIGTSRPGGNRKLGQSRSQRLNGNPNVNRLPGSRYATSEQAPQGLGNAPDRRIRRTLRVRSSR